MNSIIIYLGSDNIAKIVFPLTLEIDIIYIGIKSVPKDIPFWIIDQNELPNTPQETWVLENMGEPDGIGTA